MPSSAKDKRERAILGLAMGVGYAVAMAGATWANFDTYQGVFAGLAVAAVGFGFLLWTDHKHPEGIE